MIASSNIFQHARQYILRNGRPLDRALFLHEFEDEPYIYVYSELEKYQNTDGGFGNALEPDIRMPQSSPIATTEAFQYLNDIKDEKPLKMIKKGIDYFITTVKTFKGESQITYYWNPVKTQEVVKYPHAPWWETTKNKEPTLEEWANPSIEIISYLLQYANFVPKDFINELIEDVKTFLEVLNSLTGSVYYNFLCFKRLLPVAPIDLKDRIYQLLDETFQDSKLLTETFMKEGKIQRVVTEKSSYFYQKYPQEVKTLIKSEVNKLGKDGGSHPAWQWGDKSLWDKVEKEWTGKLTNELLITLKYTLFNLE